MSTDGFDSFDTMTPDDDEVLAGLHRSVSGATMTTSAADVVALGRRTRNRRRGVAAGIGTSAAALVAAIGALAPTAGTGARGMPDAAGQAPHSSGAQLLNIQDAGFSLEEHADGTVTLKMRDAYDPAKLRAALESAGIPSVVLVQQVPDGWDLTRGIGCTPIPGVHPTGIGPFASWIPGRPEPSVVITKSKIPAGDYLTLIDFESPNDRTVKSMSTLRVYVGRQTTCVPEYPAPSARPGK